MCPTRNDVSPLEYSTRALSNLKGVTFAHINLCSIIRKLEYVKIHLTISKLDYLIITETFLNSAIGDEELHIEGYTLFRSDSDSRSGKLSGGGIVIYANSKFDTCLLTSTCLPFLESLWLQIALPFLRKINPGAFYRPPDGMVDYRIQELSDVMCGLNLSPGDDNLLLGDMNIDYATINPVKKKLVVFLKTFGLEQLISRTTTISNMSSTCIDHIYSNNQSLFSHTGVVEPSLSDHCLIFVKRKQKRMSREKTSVKIRNY